LSGGKTAGVFARRCGSRRAGRDGRLELVRATDRPAREAPHFAISHPTDPTHVIAVLVAATHRAAASGTVIGHVGVGSRLRGNDVLEDGRAPGMAGGALAMSHRASPPCASPDLIRRPGDRRAFQLNNRVAPHLARGSRRAGRDGIWDWSGHPIARRGRLRISRFHTHTGPTHVIAVPVAATHQPAPCGTVIGHVGVGSCLSGNDVSGGWLRAGMANGALAVSQHRTPKGPRRTRSGAREIAGRFRRTIALRRNL